MSSDAGIAEAISDFLIAEIACVSCLLLPIYYVNLLFFNFFDACSECCFLADIVYYLIFAFVLSLQSKKFLSARKDIKKPIGVPTGGASPLVNL